MENQFEPNLQQQEQPQKPKKPWYKKWWIWVIIGVVGLGVIGALMPKTQNSDKEQPTTVAIATVKTTATEITTAALEVQTTVPATEMQTEETTTEAATEASSAESVLFENNGVKIIYKGVSSGWMGDTVELKIENTSNKNYTVQTHDVSVNGFMVDPLFSCDVNSGKIANDKITFLKSDFEKNGITSINDIELSFHIFNDDDWMDSFDTEKLSIKL